MASGTDTVKGVMVPVNAPGLTKVIFALPPTTPVELEQEDRAAGL